MQKNYRTILFLIISCISPYLAKAMEVIDTQTAKALYNAGLRYRYTNHNYPLAHDYFEKAAQKGHIEALEELGYMAYAENNKVLARNYKVQYLKKKKEKELATNDERIHATLHELASIYKKEGKNSKVIECHTIALQKGSIYAGICLAKIYQAEKKDDRAEGYYTQAIYMAHKTNSSYTTEIANDLATMYKEQGRDSLADEIYQLYNPQRIPTAEPGDCFLS